MVDRNLSDHHCDTVVLMPTISGKFTTPQSYDGIADLLLDGCELTGDYTGVEAAIMFRNCTNFRIRNTWIHDLKDGVGGIVARSTGKNVGIEISKVTIERVSGNGISIERGAQKSNFDVYLGHNIIEDCATFDNSKHGIYAMDCLTAEWNVIRGAAGNGISARSGGLYRHNTVNVKGKSAFRYFSDHPASEDPLIVEWNTLIGSGLGYPVLSLLNSSVVNLVDEYHIRNNTILSKFGYAFQAQSPEFQHRDVYFYENICFGEIDKRYVKEWKNIELGAML